MHTLLLICFTLTIIHAQDPILCPADTGLLHSNRLTFSKANTPSFSAIIPITQTLIYNYTFPLPFNNIPGISLALDSFQSQSSPYLMFGVKPLPLNSLTSVSLLVRFFQKYTSWVMISFGFLAEDRTDIQADYIELDTGLLSTEASGKAVKVSLPIQSKFNNLSAVYFISGMELATTSVGGVLGKFTPFEIQTKGISSNVSSLELIISTTTASQIYSLTISFIVFQNSSNLYFGAFEYNPLSQTPSPFLSTPVNIPASALAQLWGISGLIIPNLYGSSSFSTALVNSSFQFSSTPGISYLTYQYFSIVATNKCFICQKQSFFYNSTCLQKCPNATNAYEGTCYMCKANQIWNGTVCKISCQGGMVWNANSKKCECLPLANWNGFSCITCPAGEVWNAIQANCSCPDPNQFWDGTKCQSVKCGATQLLNPISLQCDCPPGQFVNGTNCVTCPNLMMWNGLQCICMEIYTLNSNGQCTNCSNGMVWNTNSSSCSCPSNSYFNGLQCLTCNGGMVFDNNNNRCTCPQNQIWNNTNCISPCTAPLIYISQQCTCPSNTIAFNGECIPSPTCPANQVFNGTTCIPISCAAGLFWNGTACIKYTQTCPINTFWNGKTCVVNNIQCPNGSTWNGTYCVGSNNCPLGTYSNSGNCQYFPVICPPNYQWNNDRCLALGPAATCLPQQIFNGAVCVDVNCSSGRVWSSKWNQCVCNSSSFWNGFNCVSCPEGQIFSAGSCVCPDGFFMVESACYGLKQMYCFYVTNSQWNGTSCLCNPGFTSVGTTCVCYGLIVNNFCNICYNIQNSLYKDGYCVCQTGYYMMQGQCKLFPNNNTNPNATCQPGTLASNSICIPCSDGCLSCVSQSVCLQCRPEFSYNWATLSCIQNCGDGLRFVLPCDDGNNFNGDGCSGLCQIESGFSCLGGSPNFKDVCTQSIPSRMVVNMTGTSHMFGKIIINFKTNYLPSNITNPPTPCTYLCNQTLTVAVASGDTQYTNITKSYFPGTYSFAVEINFGREPIGQFNVSVGFEPTIAAKYFPTVLSSEVFSFSVTPAFLSVVGSNDNLS